MKSASGSSWSTRARPRLSTAGSVMASVGLIAAVAVGAAGFKGHAASRIDLSSGSAWFPSPDAGTVSLINGLNVSRVAQVPVAPAGDQIETVQAGSGSYVVDRTTGQVTRVDGALLTAGTPVTLDEAGDQRLSLATAGSVTWALERSGTEIQELDPRSLVPLGSPLPFPGTADSSVITPDGTFWALGNGELAAFRDGRPVAQRQVGGADNQEIVVASGQPVVLDSTTHSARELDVNSGKDLRTACFDASGSGDLVSGSDSGPPTVLAVSPSTSTLLVSDLATASCRAVLLTGVSAGDELGGPVDDGGVAFIPDFTAGTAIVVDLKSSAILGEPQVEQPGSPFVLLPYAGAVWFDDANQDTAGIVTAQGTIAVSTTTGSTLGKRVPTIHRHTGPLPTVPTTSTTTTTLKPPSPTTSTTVPPPPPAASTTTVAVTTTTTIAISSKGGGSTTSTTTTTAPPAPAFTWSPVTGQENVAVAFTDTTPGAHTDSWTFPNGNPATSTVSNPTVTWATPGTFTVTLTVTRSGAGQSVQHSVQIAAPADVTVPDVAGDTVAQATSALQAAGLAVGSQTPVYSFILKGDVASSSPASGTAVPKGTAVTLNTSEQTGQINTYATGIADPARLTVDSSGNLYVPSNSGNVVFKVAPGGSTSVFAGNGIAGNFNSSNALTSTLNQPIAVALDGSGNVYIAEQGNNDIRKVTPSGTISTLASVVTPWGLTYFNSTLYVVDRSQCVVDTVNTSTDAVTTVLGQSGNCGMTGTLLDDPSSLTFGPNGAMYITEPHEAVVREYSNLILSTFAGTGSQGDSGNGGPAASAELNNPDDVVFDTSGNMYINDWGNCSVREITPDGTIQTVGGTGACGAATGDGGPADQAQMQNGGNGNYSGGLVLYGTFLFVSDTNNNVIREISSV